MGSLKVLAKWTISQYSQNFSLHLAIALLLFLFSLFFRHGPFPVRSVQTRPPFNGFAQRCTHLDVHDPCWRLSVLHLRRRLVSTAVIPGTPCSGVWDPWSVEYKACKLAMLHQRGKGGRPWVAQNFTSDYKPPTRLNHFHNSHTLKHLNTENHTTHPSEFLNYTEHALPSCSCCHLFC